MAKIIQFPDNNSDKNSKKVVKAKNSNKSLFVIMASLLTLVTGLSLYNSRSVNELNVSANKGRGLASVNEFEFSYDDKKLIKLINSENSRKIANLGIAGSRVDELVFGELSEEFQITRSHLNIVTSVKKIKDASSNGQIQFEKGFLEKYKEAFGASKIKVKSEFEAQSRSRLLSTYSLYNSNDEVFAEAEVLTSVVKELISININL